MMTTTIRVRQAGPTDLEDLARLFDGYRQFYHQPSELPKVTRFLEDRLRNGDSFIFLGFLEAGLRPAGFVQLYPVFSSVTIGRALILNDLFVAPEFRGHGVARALLEQGAAFGRATGAKYLELATHESNAGAQRLYEGAGWVRETEFRHYELDLR